MVRHASGRQRCFFLEEGIQTFLVLVLVAEITPIKRFIVAYSDVT